MTKIVSMSLSAVGAARPDWQSFSHPWSVDLQAEALIR
jgi:hypothetical protein